LSKSQIDLPDKPKEAKEWRTMTEPDKIEQLIMERQKVHFGHQASPTPFANAPLKSTFNWTGTSPEVQVVLNGDYQTGLSSPAPKKCLPSCPSYSSNQ
jgi:hypothetical protein